MNRYKLDPTTLTNQHRQAIVIEAGIQGVDLNKAHLAPIVITIDPDDTGTITYDRFTYQPDGQIAVTRGLDGRSEEVITEETTEPLSNPAALLDAIGETP